MGGAHLECLHQYLGAADKLGLLTLLRSHACLQLLHFFLLAVDHIQVSLHWPSTESTVRPGPHIASATCSKHASAYTQESCNNLPQKFGTAYPDIASHHVSLNMQAVPGLARRNVEFMSGVPSRKAVGNLLALAEAPLGLFVALGMYLLEGLGRSRRRRRWFLSASLSPASFPALAA